MSTFKSRDFLIIIADEIGPDIEQIRPMNNKFYHTGIDLSLLLSGQVLIPLIITYLHQITKSITPTVKAIAKKQGEQIAKKLEQLADSISKIDLESIDAIKLLNKEAQELLDEGLSLIEQENLIIKPDDDYRKQLKQVLISRGVPEKIAKETAKNIVERIQKKLKKNAERK